MVNLGFMELPLSGKYSFLLAVAGIATGAFVIVSTFQTATMTGPALAFKGSITVEKAAAQFIDSCRPTLLVTAGLCLLYYNYLGCAVLSVFLVTIFKIIDAKNVNEKFSAVAGRFSGNMAEQAPVFLTALWIYTLFVDAGSAPALGAVYLAQRLSYPFFYIVCGEFTMWFEFSTQVGYGVNGALLAGILVTGFGGDWIATVAANPVSAPLCAFLLGSVSVFPTLPLGPLLMPLHFFFHRTVHNKPKKA